MDILVIVIVFVFFLALFFTRKVISKFKKSPYLNDKRFGWFLDRLFWLATSLFASIGMPIFLIVSFFNLVMLLTGSGCPNAEDLENERRKIYIKEMYDSIWNQIWANQKTCAPTLVARAEQERYQKAMQGK